MYCKYKNPVFFLTLNFDKNSNLIRNLTNKILYPIPDLISMHSCEIYTLIFHTHTHTNNQISPFYNKIIWCNHWKQLYVIWYDNCLIKSNFSLKAIKCEFRFFFRHRTLEKQNGYRSNLIDTIVCCCIKSLF